MNKAENMTELYARIAKGEKQIQSTLFYFLRSVGPEDTVLAAAADDTNNANAT